MMVCIQESLTVRVFISDIVTHIWIWELSRIAVLYFDCCIGGVVLLCIAWGHDTESKDCFLTERLYCKWQFFPPSVTWGNLHLQIPTWPIALCRYHRYSTVQKSQPVIYLCFLSKEPDFLFHPFLVQSLYFGISEVFFLFIKPLNTNLWIIQGSLKTGLTE